MKEITVTYIKYEASEGKVFDYKDLSLHTHTDEAGNIIQDHLNTKRLYIGKYDSIDNYIEIDEPEVIDNEYIED